MSSEILALATYGTLRPGRANHHVVSAISGSWVRGTVHGWLVEQGNAATEGFPALRLDPDGPAVSVDVLVSEELHLHWDRLDEFEGAGYLRVIVEVETDAGIIRAQMYEVRD